MLFSHEVLCISIEYASVQSREVQDKSFLEYADKIDGIFGIFCITEGSCYELDI